MLYAASMDEDEVNELIETIMDFLSDQVVRLHVVDCQYHDARSFKGVWLPSTWQRKFSTLHST